MKLGTPTLREIVIITLVTTLAFSLVKMMVGDVSLFVKSMDKSIPVSFVCGNENHNEYGLRHASIIPYTFHDSTAVVDYLTWDKRRTVGRRRIYLGSQVKVLDTMYNGSVYAIKVLKNGYDGPEMGYFIINSSYITNAPCDSLIPVF